jgi:hypothetical protein
VDLWTASPDLTDKEWHHVAMTWSRESLELYLDGSLRASLDAPGVAPSDLGRTEPDYLGRTLDDEEVALYAEIDDLRVYARALTSGEIAELFVEP